MTKPIYPGVSDNVKEIQNQLCELRAGYWDVIFHTRLTLEEKRGFTSYFRSADKYVTDHGGESILDSFNKTCKDCGFEKLIIGK
ncbi:hypothetical protein [Teredinibacter purpureus]|uniref:hypothetical protein n=1 Tax=Teredinibacter purpureus TaxID=2731756 RepID=UPI0005F7ED53|nr:hypothetical protein [Teredinibacter purpureus]